MTEEWKDIPGYEGIYQVSNYGRIRSLARSFIVGRGVKSVHERMMRTNVWYGYEVVWFRIQGVRKKYRVHRLVASLFLEKPDDPDAVEVNHKDKNRLNNAYSNLEWCNHIENCIHRDQAF